MSSFGPDSLNQVSQVLANTLSTNLKERNAEVELKTLSTFPGFGEILIKLICNNEVTSEIRMAAALALKNFVKENWGGEGNALLPEEERQSLRAMVLNALFELILPIPLRRQMTSSIFFMAKVDFPEKWPELIEKIGQGLVVSDANFDKLNSALSTLEELTKRYKYEMRSNKLWTEILLVLNTVANPLTVLFQQMLQYKPNNSEDALSYLDRVAWVDIILSIVKIFHSLVSQDLPEFFEDNLVIWMQSFNSLLSLKIVSLEQNTDDSESNSLDKLKCTIIDVATLFSQRYEECFLPFTEEFIRSSWSLLVETDGRIRFDSMVNAALGFLSAITQRQQYMHYFQGEGVLKAICDNVIIKNLILRTEDMEMYEHEPFEFLKRDIEGSDLETRRRGATDFVRALCKQFETEIFGILSSTINTFLEDYRQNPVENIVKKDAVYFLVSAMASKSTTAKHGATSTSQLINISDFYEAHVRMDLLEGSPNDSPILRSDAIKYLVLFRNQLRPELILEVFCGKNNQSENSILRLFNSQHILLHHYLAYGIERLLLLKNANKQPLFDNTNIPIAKLIDHLFGSFSNVSAYHTHYIMKALMRCFSLIDFDINKTAHTYVENLQKMIVQAIANPLNSLLVHFIFESICVLIRRAYTKVEGGIDKYVLPILELIIPKDVIDFVPYALQLTALLLDQSKEERQKGIEVDQTQYLNFFPFLLRAEMWSRTANIPAIMLVFESFISSFPQVIFGAEYLDQMLGVFQRLIGSKAHDIHGFRLAIAILPYIDKIDNLTSRDILLKMLNRQHQLKTIKYTKQFVFFLFRYAYLKGGLVLATTLESFQKGLFSMLLEKIIIPEMKLMPQTTTYEEKRLVIIGVVAILNDMGQNIGELTNQLIQSSLAIIDSISKPAEANQENQVTETSPTEEIEQYVDETNEMEYTDQYCRLSYAQHKDLIGKEIVDIRGYLSQAVARLQNNN